MLKHVIINHTVARLIVSNNGSPFTKTDWSRLRNIAEGNPDETKIGAFGVGFYSVFSDSDEPFVISGNETMAFYWKGNALYTKRGTIPSEEINLNTAFVLDYRNTDSQTPSLSSLCRFLCTSLTFVNLDGIELWIDDWNVLSLAKKLSSATPVIIPKDFDVSTQGMLMRVKSLSNRLGQIDANYINVVGWSPNHNVVKRSEPSLEKAGFREFFSRLAHSTLKVASTYNQAVKDEEELQQAIADDVLGLSKATVFVRLIFADIQTKCGRALVHELERATKKAPPGQTNIAVLTIPFDAQSASISSGTGIAAKKASELFSSITPKEGKIFIGFQTAQTTGYEAHVSVPSLIPTVERENVDLSAKHVRTWNSELLRAVGIVLRISYMLDYNSLRKYPIYAEMAEKDNPSDSLNEKEVVTAAIHTMKCYTKCQSTPSHAVADLIDDAFWRTNMQNIEILSTKGIISSREARISMESLKFLTTVPIVPKTILERTAAFSQKLFELGMISDVSIGDIRFDLESKALSEAHFQEFLRWTASKITTMEIDVEALGNLFNVTIVSLEPKNSASAENCIVPLSGIKTFINGTSIPPDYPVPSSTLPFRLTKTFSRHQLLAFGWRELSMFQWMQFLVKNSNNMPESHKIDSSPEFAGKVLQALSKSWDNCPEKSQLIELLGSKTVIPTKQGMKMPHAAYFPTVKLFDDLPIIKGLHGVKEKFLAALGVRKTIELGVVFSRLMVDQERDSKREGTWSHVDLVKYLSTVQKDIPQSDIERLRQLRIWPKEKTLNSNEKTTFHTISELYRPLDELKPLSLPFLQWSGKFNAEGSDGLFLRYIGLQSYPSASQLIDIMVKGRKMKDAILWNHAMKFFLENYYSNNYAQFDIKLCQNIQFLPLLKEPFPELSAPVQIFTNERASIMAYKILRSDLHAHADKLGVSRDPSILSVVENLISSPPSDHSHARAIFEYLSGRLQEFETKIADRLGNSRIVPIRSKNERGSLKSEAPTYTYTTPRMSFLGDSSVYGKILDFVDFGPDGNAFLMKIGAGREPGVVDLAKKLASHPQNLLDILGQHKFLDLLRKLSENFLPLRADRVLWEQLKSNATILGYRDVSDPYRTRLNDAEINTEVVDRVLEDMLEDDGLVREWSLAYPSDLVAVDSIEDYTIFRESLLAAPQEENLEAFYIALGTQFVSDLVTSTRRVGSAYRDQSSARRLQRLILERCRIFLHDHSSNNIKHDIKWLEKYLQVVTVEHISLHKSLPSYGATHTEKVSACLTKSVPGRMYILSITQSFDLYEVSQALVQELLKRHRQQDVMALEVILGSDLRRLKMRGYNVDRILRQRELESRIAIKNQQEALTKQQKELATEESNEIMPQEVDVARNNAASETNSAVRTRIEENSNTSMQTNKSAAKSGRSTSKFLSDLTRRFGLNDVGSKSYTKLVENSPDLSTATSEALERNLASAISSSRSHNSDSIFSAPKTTTIPEAEQGAYCDSSEGHDLILCSVTTTGMKIFLPRQNNGLMQTVQADSSAIESFEHILLTCASVFELDQASLNIFYGNQSRSIAFNYNGSIFCNFHYFKQLHEANVDISAEARAQAGIYWFVVLCHELAHNLVSAHDSKHSFYSESFVQKYFSKMAQLSLRT